MRQSAHAHYLLDRHYIRIKIFKWTFTLWDPSPRKVYEHLIEVQQQDRAYLAQMLDRVTAEKDKEITDLKQQIVALEKTINTISLR